MLALDIRRFALRGFVILGWLAALGLINGGLSAPTFGATTTCSPASTKGADGPIDYGAYCWIDFTALNVTQVENGGQNFQVNLPGGVATLTFTLNVTGDANGLQITSAAVPSWSGAAFGNFAFNGIPGRPVIYQTNNNGGTTTATLTNVTLHANGTTDLPFVFVAADGESSNQGESLSFTTSGDAWSLVASPGLNEGYATPTLTYSNGGKTALETGVGSGNTTSYVFTTDNSPGTVQATMVGTGLQGVIFGVKYHTIGLSLTKTHAGEFKAGGSGAYTINVTNTVTPPTVNPPSAPQPVQVVDTLPTGLAYVPTGSGGSGWACSASGQVITCNTTALQDLTTSKTFPPITINVNVANNAPATLTNNAAVSDPTTSTLVFNVCEVTDNGVCPNSATSTAGDPTVIIHSNLSTSTKTVVDLNGGDAEPNDVLEYTITLTESAGLVANNVSVTDDMPNHVGNLTVVSTPAGSTDNSTATGGANGTGKLDISGISVPANGSVTIVYDVSIDNGTAAGTTIDNNVDIANPDPNGTGATPSAPTITVSQSSLPTSGNKVLYLYDNTGPPYTSILNRVPQTAYTTNPVTLNNGSNFTWNLSPTIATGKTLVLPAQDVNVNLVMAARGSRINRSRNVTATLYSGNTPIGNTTFNNVRNGDSLYTSTIHISAQTVPAGSGLNLRIDNNENANNHNITVSQRVAGVGNSSISFTTSTVINVDNVGTYSDAGCTTPVSPAYQAGSTVYLCAVISDPFGNTDIDTSPGGTTPSVAIVDANSNGQVTAVMTPVPGLTTAASKTFEYSYTVPTSPSLGNWTATVTAWEGTEHTVYDSGIGTFNVQAPHPNLSTSTKTVVDVNGGDHNPGDVLEYTVTLIETAGVAASNVHVTDDMPAHVGGLTVTNDAGGTDSSTTTGGANGTGYLDINGISVPANGSKTVVFDVTIVAGATPGTTIDNTATITSPNGPGATPSAPTITVSQSQIPASGNKILYVYDNGNLTRTPQTGAGSGGVSITNQGGTAAWTLTPALAKALTIEANSQISVNLLVQCAQEWFGGGCVNFFGPLQWTAALYDNTVSAGTQIGSTSPPASFSHTSYTEETANIQIGSSDVTIAAGHKLILVITNNAANNYFGNNYSTMQVEQYAGSSGSNVNLNVSTVINVDSVDTYTDATCNTPLANAIYETASPVYICAVVSDPFGSYDIDPATGGTTPTITIKDATGATQVNAADMTLVTDSGAATKTFGYTYILPTSPPATLELGHWTPSVTAWEGTEHTIHDLGNGIFEVGAPNLVVLKSVSVVSGPVHGTANPKALPGSKMKYTVLVTNQGKGTVDNNQLAVTDAIPANTAFVVGSVNGSGSGSGLSALDAGDIEYSNDNGSSWTYSPVGSPGSTDPAVTNIRFSPQGSMDGKSGATAPAYTITFNVVIQ